MQTEFGNRAPNGIRKYILPLQDLDTRNFLALVVNIGSSIENILEKGIAHFLEHMQMSFYDTKHALYGAFAHTDFYSTTYYFDIQKADITEIQKIIQCIINGTYIEYANMDEIRNDILVEYDYYQRKRRYADFECLLKGSEYERCFPIGKKSCINSFTRTQLQHFFSKYYSLNNMALVWIADQKTLSEFGTAWINQLKGINTDYEIKNLGFKFKNGKQCVINGTSKQDVAYYYYRKRQQGEEALDAMILLSIEETLQSYYSDIQLAKMFLSRNDEFIKVSFKEKVPYYDFIDKIECSKDTIMDKCIGMQKEPPIGYNCDALREQLVNLFVFNDKVCQTENNISFDYSLNTIEKTLKSVPFTIIHK